MRGELRLNCREAYRTDLDRSIFAHFEAPVWLLPCRPGQNRICLSEAQGKSQAYENASREAYEECHMFAQDDP
jgi:hypothetical protein